ncbi:MAG: PEP-utilizing enzyme, partial [Actinomycetota bacterium]|nr:PEP-utilizing enzyme [Actinomycetota bacterium]
GSAGTHIGVARVALRVEDAAAVRPGEVLVCPVTAPAWNLAMARAGAVVCDTGGQLSHAAITARELSVPAVVGCRDATATLRTGERVLVDGAAGTVRRL